jgi:CarD family transcriptional regulator
VKTINRGVAVSRAQAVSQKTRKQSASKNTKKSAAASRGASKGRAKAPVKGAKKAAAAKSSNKRSAMPPKNAKTVAKAAGSKSSASKAPAKTAAKAPVAKPAAAVKPVAAAAPKVAVKPAVPPRVEEKKPLTQRQGFKTNEFVVYPAHGVGQILAIEEQEIAGARLELFVINFIKDKMTLRVPTAKVANVGMRKLSDPLLVKRALETLKGRARVKRTMWSRRAQEYEAKINSGDIVAIAEVVRDLYRSESQPEQSYSERQLYEAALDRLSREIAVVQHSTETEAVKEIESQLAKSPRRGAKTEGDAVAEGDAEGDEDADAEGDNAAVEDEAA